MNPKIQLANILHIINININYRPIFNLFSLLILLAIVTFVLIKLIIIFKEMKKPKVFYEIKPLVGFKQNRNTTQQFINLLHTFCQPKTRIEKLFRMNKKISLEIVSTKEKGIIYLICCSDDIGEFIEKTLLSYLPGVEIKKTTEYLKKSREKISITELGLSNHFIYPLKSHENPSKEDPADFLVGTLTKLKDKELISIQLVTTPVNKQIIPDIKKSFNLIYGRKDLVKNTNNSNTTCKLLTHILQIFLFPVGLIIFLLTDGKEGPFIKTFSKSKKTLNPYQQELEKIIKQKTDQPLFKTSLRILVKSKNENKQKNIISTIGSISRTNYQSLKTISNFKCGFMYKLHLFLYKNRLIKPFTKTILSVAEIGDIYHFPFIPTQTEGLQKQHYKELPTPVSLKKSQDLDVIFAKNSYGGVETQIGLKEKERRRHIYILGATGTGKSTMLLSMINSDLKNGKGIAVIDPHGDLIDQALHIIPKRRISDVIYFNPDDIKYPIGINLLELSEGLDREDSLKEKDYIAESIISLIHKVYSKKYTGPRMEYILRNTIHTAFSLPDPTLFTVYKLLINSRFRKSVVRKIEDENLRDFWRYEFARAGNYQKVKMISPITNKIGRFLFSPTVKRIIEQKKSTIDFNKIIDNKKILLCNLSKGKIGEDNSKLLGSLMMAKLQLAALKRSPIPINQRQDFYLYVDEFQDFATTAFAQILSEARKYRLNAILAHQTISQIEDKSLVNITIANTGTVISFKTANPIDEKFIQPQFSPYVEKNEILNLPAYKFYIKLGGLNPEEPFSGITTPVRIKLNNKKVDQIIKHSRKKYAQKYSKPVSEKTTNKKPVIKKEDEKPDYHILP